MSIVKEAFDNHARFVRRSFKSDRMKTVGASEIGLCARKTWYVKHNAARDVEYVDGWGAARRGVTFEKQFFVPAMRKHYGENLIDTGAQQKRHVDGYLSATPDGILINQKRNLLASLMVPDIGPGKCILLECKTIDPRINLSEAKAAHVFQAQVQLGLVRKLTKHQPEYCVLVYTNASFFDDNVEFVVRFDPAVFAEAEKRAKRIMLADAADKLKPEGWIGGASECGYCPYAKSCMGIRANVPENEEVASNPQFVAELIDLANQEREANATMKTAEIAHRELQEKIKSRLREKGLRFVKTRELNVAWSAVKGRLSFDMPKIKAAAVAAGIDLQQFETVGEPTDRLLVSVIKRDRLVK